ncbi:hypothetical protein ABZ128_13605 [Streptomyces sp. NPDC006326]|uniref:hypothetical protein n=1 Tax=Streptomyces sp. NPDC006326 TaxID=3156752 RepID=UPI0033A47377
MAITRTRRIVPLMIATALATGGVSLTTTAFAAPNTTPASITADGDNPTRAKLLTHLNIDKLSKIPLTHRAVLTKATPDSIGTGGSTNQDNTNIGTGGAPNQDDNGSVGTGGSSNQDNNQGSSDSIATGGSTNQDNNDSSPGGPGRNDDIVIYTPNTPSGPVVN